MPLYGKLLEVSRTLEELPWCEDRASEITSLDQIASAASAFVDDLIAKRQRIANKFQLMGPQMKITADDLGNFATNGRKGMDNLEVFMRHCAAWSRHTRGEIMYASPVHPDSWQ